MRHLRRLLRYVQPLYHYLPEYLVYTVLAIVFGILNFTMLIPLLNLLFNTSDIAAATKLPEYSFSIAYFSAWFNHHIGTLALEQGKLQALAQVCMVIAGATLFSNIFRYLATRVMVRLKLNLLKRLREHLYESISRQTLGWFHRNRKGDLLSTMTNDVQEIEFSVISSFQVLLRDPFVIIAYFITLFYLSPDLTVFTILFFPVSGLLISTLARKLKKKGYFSQELLGRILQHTDETLSGIRIIQSFGAAGRFRTRFSRINTDFTTNSKALFNQRELASPLSDLLGVVVVVVVVMYGGKLVLDGALSGSTFITYLALYSQILQPAKNISAAVSNMQKGLVSSERVFSILDAPVEVKDAPEATEAPPFSGRIDYQHVGFAYQAGSPVLSEITLSLEKGRKLALVGRSGSGKSTLADLLLRFYNPTEGQILWDGVPLNRFTMAGLRRQIGLVNQDPVIFNDTVEHNITMGEEQPDRERLFEAARNAHALEFIEAMPEGFSTVLGDRGSRLSGGQRQRIAIARALYYNPPILILDEATSALDSESERAVQEALDRLMENRTTLIIAHRLSTVRNADWIVVLQQGEIVEQGTHSDLLALNGHYKKLYELQEL